LTPGERKLVGGRSHNSLLELVVIVAVAIGLALLIQAFLIKPYRIPSESMEPTLDVGQRVLVSRFNYHFSDPDRGDVVVFHPPKGANSNTCGAQKPEDQACSRPTADEDSVNFIKRIVAVPGDTLSIRQGHAVVNGKQQKEDFTSPCAPGTCNFPRPIKIPPGHFFMMGDNRGASDDSRFWGPVPEKWIIGQAFATYWPPKRWGIL
jgi:signal peptidase I